MKLHLPSALRKALLTCIAAFTPTLATGVFTGGVALFAICSQAQAGTWTNGEYILSGNEDAVTEPNGDGTYKVSLVNTASSSFVGTFTAQNNSTTQFYSQNTGTDTLIRLDNFVIGDGSGTASVETLSPSNFRLYLKAVQGTLGHVTNRTDMQIGWSETTNLSQTIANNGTLTLAGKFSIAKDYVKNFTIYEAGSPLSEGTDGYITGVARLLVDGAASSSLTISNMQWYGETDDHCIIVDGKEVVVQKSGNHLYFMDESSSAAGTVYYIKSAGKVVKASEQQVNATTSETGYVLMGDGAVLVVDEAFAGKDGIVADAGAGTVTLQMAVGGSLDAGKMTVRSGTLHAALAEGAAWSLASETPINGTVTVNGGAELILAHASALKNASSLVLAGSESKVAQVKLTGQMLNVGGDMELTGNASVSGGTLQFDASYPQIYAAGTQNVISSAVATSKQLIVKVGSGGELLMSGKIAHTDSKVGQYDENLTKTGDGTLILGGSAMHEFAGKVAVYGGELQLADNAKVTMQQLVLGNGKSFSVGSGAAVTIKAISTPLKATLSGSISVASTGSLTLGAVTLSNAADRISISGTTTVGEGFRKSGEGSLTLAALKVSKDAGLLMNGHTGLTVQSYIVDKGATLIYGSGAVLSIGTISQSITLDVSAVKSALSSESGLDTGIELAAGQDLETDFRNLLTLNGAGSFLLSVDEVSKHVFIKSDILSDTPWDANWGAEEVLDAPTPAAMTVTGKAVSCDLNGTEITGGGSAADTLIAGGVVRQKEADVRNLSGESWVLVSGGSSQAIVGGNVNMGSGAGAANFAGDSHVMMTGGSTQMLIGGNMWDLAGPSFEGDTYVSAFSGAEVARGIVGGSTTHFGQHVVLQGDTNVFVYTVLQDADADTRGFVLGGNYHEAAPLAAVSSVLNLQVTGTAHVLVDLSDYELADGAPSAFTKHIIGGHYHAAKGYVSSIAATDVSIKGAAGVTFSGDIIGGTRTNSFEAAGATNTSVSISGNATYTGRVIAGHADDGKQGTTAVNGTSKLTIDGGTFNHYVVGGSSLAAVKDATEGDAYVNTVQMTLSGGDFNAMVAGGCLLAGEANSNADSVAARAEVGVVSMALSGSAEIDSVCGGHLFENRTMAIVDKTPKVATVGNITIDVDGATIGKLYGGSYLSTQYGNTAVKHGDIIINLKSGTLTGSLFAAGGAMLGENMTTDSTTVNVGKDFRFGSGVGAIYGGYFRDAAVAAQSQYDGSFKVKKGAKLNFADAAEYSAMTGITAADFTELAAAEGATASLYAVQNAGKALTKSGAGSIQIATQAELNSLAITGGIIEFSGGIKSAASGLSLTASGGAAAKVTGDLTLASLEVDMAGLTPGANVLDLSGKLSGVNGKLNVKLTNYKNLAVGSYCLAKIASLAAGTVENLQEAFVAAPEGMEYKLELSSTGLMFHYRYLSQWTWEGSANGESTVWSDVSDNGWKYDGEETPSGQILYFNSDGASEAAGSGQVTVSGTVTPAGIEITGGEYTFLSDASTPGSVKLTPTEEVSAPTLKIGTGATLNMNLANAELGGITDLQGTLKLNDADGLGNTKLQFNGGTLVYAEGITTDLSGIVDKNNSTDAVKIVVTDAADTVDWGAMKWLAAVPGIQAVANHGLEFNADAVHGGNGNLAMRLNISNTLTFKGPITVGAGKLTFEVGNNTPTFSGAITVAKDATLELLSPRDSGGNASVFTVSGKFAGEGDILIGNTENLSGRYYIQGDNSAFKGKIILNGTGTDAAGNRALFSNGKSSGGADTTLVVNGRGFIFPATCTTAVNVEVLGNSAGNMLGGAAGQSYTFTGAWKSEAGAAFTAVDGQAITIGLSGDLTQYKGTFKSATQNTWVLGGDGAAGSGSLDMKALSGTGTFKVQYGNQTLLHSEVADTANLQQSGSGKLVLAAANTTSGKLTVDSGKVVQLGDASAAATWAGSELDGAGSFILTNGTLSNLSSVTGGAKLCVETVAGSAASAYSLRSAAAASAGTVVDMTGSDAALLSAITLAERSRLILDDALSVGGAGASLTMNLTAADFGTALPDAADAMISAPSLTLAAVEGISLRMNIEDLRNALNAASADGAEGNVYLRLVSGSLAIGSGVDVNRLINPELLRFGVRAHATAEGLAGGYLVINGSINGVYFTDEQQDASGNPAMVEVADARLDAYAGVVINSGDTLCINLNAADGPTSTTVNNLTGINNSDLLVKAGDVVLSNVLRNTGHPDDAYETMGADNTLAGSLTAQRGTSIIIRGLADDSTGAHSGSLTVTGDTVADTLTVQSGSFAMLGEHNSINSFESAAGTATTLGGDASLSLGDAIINGSLSGADGASVTTSGSVSIGAAAQLEGVSLSIQNRSAVEVQSGEYQNLAALNAESGATLSGMGALIVMGNYQGLGNEDSGEGGIMPLSGSAPGSSSFAGSLSGQFNELYIGADHDFTFDNASGDGGWNVQVQGNLTVDATKGNSPALSLGQLSLKDNADLTLRFNSDNRNGNNLNVLNLLNLDFAADSANAAYRVTLESTGQSQLESGRYILGELTNGISYNGAAFQASEIDLTDIELTLLGTAFARIDTELTKLMVSEGSLVLNLVQSDANPFMHPDLSTNASAGATLLWNSLPPADGELQDAYNSVNYMLADGDVAGADEKMAAVAGASATALGVAFAGDVERQLRAIRNRTTTMGVNQCVVNEGMPYFNAWVNAEGNQTELDKDGTNPGYTLDSWGGTVGFDVDLNPHLTLGLAITAMYGDLTADGPEDAAEGDLDTYYLSAFARYSKRAWTHTFIATVGMMEGSLERTVSHTYGSYTTKGETDGMAFGLMYELGRVYALDDRGDTCWQPVLNLAYRHVTVGGYEETNSDAALEIGDQTLDTFTIAAGARLQSVIGENMFNRTSLFEARALAKFDIGDRASEADVALLHGTGSATIESAEPGAFGVELGAGLSIPLGDENDGTLFLDLSAELRSGYTDLNGTVGYRINF